MISWLVTILLAVIVVIISAFYWIKITGESYWKKRGIEPINKKTNTKIFLEFFFGKKTNVDLIRHYYEICEGKLGGYFQFSTPALLLCDPELIMQILIKDFSHFEDRTPQMHGKDLLNLGLGNLSTDEWRNARPILTPAFTSGRLKIMFDPIKEKSIEVVEYLKEKTEQEIDARDLSMKFILNVIADVAFGLQVHALKENETTNEFLLASSKFFKPSYKQLIKIVAAMFFPKINKLLNLTGVDSSVNDFFFKLTTDTINYRKKYGVRKNDFLQLMLDQKTKIEENLENKTEPENSNEVEDNVLLKELKNNSFENKVKYSEILTDTFIASQTFLFISGGSETIASAISFVLLELALNINYQEKVYQEIKNVLSNNEFDYNAIKKLTYMEQFINETFRVHPISVSQSRMCTRSYKIPGTESIIEKGTFINIPVVGLHNDPKYYPEPDTFNPDRFENMDAIPKGAFFSFSYGPRMCIASRLAMLQMKIFLAVLLSTYEVTLGKKTQLPLIPMSNALIPNIKGGTWVQFKERKIKQSL